MPVHEKNDHPVGMIEVVGVMEMEAGAAQEGTVVEEGRAGINPNI